MFYNEYASVSKILGALLYFRPSEFQQHGIDQVLEFKAPEQDSSELLLQFQQVLEQFKQADQASLNEAHDEFFSGIADMPVPPWGSVYLDRECVLFGESTAEYKQFLIKNGFEFDTHNNDPLDHIGLMMMTLGELLEPQLDDVPSAALNELLSMHMLPWTSHYLAQIQPMVKEPAYLQTLTLCQSVLQQVSAALNIQVTPRQVYFNISTKS